MTVTISSLVPMRLDMIVSVIGGRVGRHITHTQQ
jgi:hypothetical protein